MACIAISLGWLGEPLAAISVAVPIHRYPPRQRAALIASLLEARDRAPASA